ncbi:MAG: hypothetical protein FJ290_08165 [Planctomycetes bacterium]|nr:hypothetical protein [Planctomycetota bacterium]
MCHAGRSPVACSGAAQGVEPKALGRAYLCADYGAGKVLLVNKEGKIEWEAKAPGAQDIWLLPNGNILFTHVKGVKEMTRDNKVVWEYKTAPANEVHACQPLPDGVVMVAESGPCRIIEVGRDCKVLKEVKLTTNCKNTHGQMRGARKLANGHYIVGQYSDAVVREYDADGKIVWEFKHKCAFAGIRLPNGNTLVATGDAHRVVEVDLKGEVVWEINENDLPGNPLRFVAGLERLPNGNTVICNWGGHGHVGQQPQIVEVSRDKKVVAELYDNKQFRTIPGVFLLDAEGDVTKCERLR